MNTFNSVAEKVIPEFDLTKWLESLPPSAERNLASDAIGSLIVTAERYVGMAVSLSDASLHLFRKLGSTDEEDAVVEAAYRANKLVYESKDADDL